MVPGCCAALLTVDVLNGQTYSADGFTSTNGLTSIRELNPVSGFNSINKLANFDGFVSTSGLLALMDSLASTGLLVSINLLAVRSSNINVFATINRPPGILGLKTINGSTHGHGLVDVEGFGSVQRNQSSNISNSISGFTVLASRGFAVATDLLLSSSSPE
jgi:hypothetical protein